ncbi:hypothetical protein [Nonomuraea dietziae]|uniref:hypothetical protein n=1 Tax=Nonomuraea dietziae TaxID=65515 RepID=UPI0031E02CAD
MLVVTLTRRAPRGHRLFVERVEVVSRWRACRSAGEALRFLRRMRGRPDLLDLYLRDMHGLECAGRQRADWLAAT